MKEIKAFIPARRIARVTEALRNSGLCDITSGHARCWNITISHVQRLLTTDDPILQQYSVDLAELVVAEAKIELVCADDVTEQLVETIAEAARTGRRAPGCLYISEITRYVELG